MQQLDQMCPICHDDILPSNIRAAHPSAENVFRHEFHLSCLSQWIMLDKKNCPVCVTPISLSETESIHLAAIAVLRATNPQLVQLLLSPGVTCSSLFDRFIIHNRFDRAAELIEAGFEIDQESLLKAVEKILENFDNIGEFEIIYDRLTSISDDLRLQIIDYLAFYFDPDFLKKLIPEDASLDIMTKIRGRLIAEFCKSNRTIQQIEELIDITGPVHDEDLIKSLNLLFIETELEYIEKDKALFMLERAKHLPLLTDHKDLFIEIINCLIYLGELELAKSLIPADISGEMITKINGIIAFEVCLSNISFDTLKEMINPEFPADPSLILKGWEILFSYENIEEMSIAKLLFMEQISKSISDESRIEFALENYQENIELVPFLLKDVENIPLEINLKLLELVFKDKNLSEFKRILSSLESIPEAFSINVLNKCIDEDLYYFFEATLSKSAFEDSSQIDSLTTRAFDSSRLDIYALLISRPESSIDLSV